MRVRGFAENARACLDLLSDGVERGDGQRAVKKNSLLSPWMAHKIMGIQISP